MPKKQGSDTLIATFESKDEANNGLHEMALTLTRAGMTEDHGVYVKCTQGVWGVWLRDRRG
jgi:hypothetical protein